MSRLRIPKNRREILISLAKLPTESVKELFGILVAFPPSAFGASLPNSVAAKVNTVEREECIKIVDTLLSLYPLVVSSSKSVNEVVDEIISVFNDGVSPDLAVNSKDLESLRQNLQSLLKVPSIGLGAKATSVKFENERTLIDSRVLTDIRPVFHLDSTDIGGALIVHTLKFDFVESGDSDKEFFVTLDSNDMDILIAKLQRAKEKAKKMQTMLVAADVDLIDSGEL